MVFTWKRNHKCEQPRYLCFVDTECYEIPNVVDTKVSQLIFRLGVARIGRWDGVNFCGVERIRFCKTKDFWDILGANCKSKSVMWVFAHNILFDGWILGLPEMLDNGTFKLSEYPKDQRNRSNVRSNKDKVFKGLCSIDKGCTIVKGILSGKRINLVDTYNYFRSSLDSIGNSIGIPKLQMPNPEADNSQWFQYCENDVKIIEEAITGLMREWKANGLGNWQPTIASLAYSSYRHRFMTRPIVCHGDEDVSKIEHDAYFDGRTSVFFSGDIGNGYSLYPGVSDGSEAKGRARIDGPCYQVDINSLYPSVMLDNNYPVEAVSDSNGKPIIWKPPSLEWLSEQLRNYLCVAICKIDTSGDYYPVRTTHGTIYPKGKIWTTLCTPEVRTALDRNLLVECMGVVLYHPWRIFDSWVNYWWERKANAEKSGNLVRREICKVLLNSLAGKLAQRNRYWINTARFPCEARWQSWCGFIPKTREPLSLRSIGQQVQYLSNDGFSDHALVAASAHVNSYARVRMLNDREAFPPKSIIYAANDGFLLTQPGYDALLESGKLDTGNLGHYRTVGTYEQVRIYGPRDYEIDGETKKAGLPKDREQVSNRRWKVKRFESHNGMIARPPDGSIHLYEEYVSGSEHHWGMYDPGDGWLRPNLVDMWNR